MRATRGLQVQGRLSVELHTDGQLDYLDVRSLLDPEQMFLLPLPVPPRIEGLSMTTTLTRVHAVTWGLAWGAGVPPAGCVVEFSSDALRFRRTVTSTPTVLDDRCWVATGEGLFATAAMLVNGVETARTPLATRY